MRATPALSNFNSNNFELNCKKLEKANRKKRVSLKYTLRNR